MKELAKQVAALPVRKAGKATVEVLLITSRDTGRWVIPKGWPSKRMSEARAALREAKQEAGVLGKIAKSPLGTYRYRKIDDAGGSQLIEVSVFLLSVKNEKKKWREKVQRERAWFDIETAAKRVRERQLKAIISALREA
jgi:8-oxo-dGTP pyrophosphatase MutT (NUDIX family)